MEKQKQSASSIVREIKRKTRRVFSAEEKIQIVLEGLRGEDSIAALCRKHGIHENNYYNWSKDFLKFKDETGNALGKRSKEYKSAKKEWLNSK